MKVRRYLMGAALAALSCGSAAWGADQSTAAPAQTDGQSPEVYYMDAATPTTLTPFMYWMSGNSVGKWMTANNLSFSGFVEGGYWYDTSNPRMGTNTAKGDDTPTLVAFPGAYSNRGQLDQLDATVQKTIDSTKSWDWGFQFENGYGTDDAQTHSNGLLDNREGRKPDNQYDILQANVSLLVPVGSGLTFKVGKFVTLLSEEVINPTGNAFFSHSYNFTFGVPLTQTGVLASYTFAKALNGQDINVTAGVTRGWNQSLRDSNGAIDFLGEVSGKWNDKLSYIFNASEGPEFPDGAGAGINQSSHHGDNSDYWTVLEFLPTYAISDQLSTTLDLLWGDFPHGSATDLGHAAQWYSVATYMSYKWNSYLTFNLRAEWYRDQGGFTVPAASGPVSANYYAATVGPTIHPLPNDNIFQWLELRPELRFDWSDRPVFNAAHSSALGGVGDYDQLSVAMDAIMQF
jgi:putative OmpL-like beta-barrel porin-2